MSFGWLKRLGEWLLPSIVDAVAKKAAKKDGDR